MDFATTASFTDNNVVSAVWNWGDGQSSAGAIAGSEVAGSHAYLAAGVYTVSCAVEDACGSKAQLSYTYVVAYDPSAGFVTGGGWINSPAGAYIYNPASTGKASFGFVAKYKKGANTPDGNTQFQYHAGDFRFKSTAYEWLVVAGYKAMYKGTGEVNGVGGYGFQLSAIDGAKKSSTEPDRIRMKVWNSVGQVIYDNQMGSADDAEATMAIAQGSIVIHDGGKKNARIALADKLTAYPNPVQEEGLTLELPVAAQQAKVIVYSLSGKVVAQEQFNFASEESRIDWNVNTQQWNGGMYVLMVQTEAETYQVKLVKR